MVTNYCVICYLELITVHVQTQIYVFTCMSPAEPLLILYVLAGLTYLLILYKPVSCSILYYL